MCFSCAVSYSLSSLIRNCQREKTSEKKAPKQSLWLVEWGEIIKVAFPVIELSFLSSATPSRLRRLAPYIQKESKKTYKTQ